jgi:hypothetical protein
MTGALWFFKRSCGEARLSHLWGLLALALALPAVRAAEPDLEERMSGGAILLNTKPLVFDLEQVSAFDLIAQSPEFGIGQRVQCGDVPDANVTAYPAFTSGKPICGLVQIGGEPGRKGSGMCLRFLIDESDGTGKGRLFRDRGHPSGLWC